MPPRLSSVAERDRATDRAAGSLSADEVVAVVRVHLDRVGDAVRRTGCAGPDLLDVVRTSALELVDRAAAAPSTAESLAGEWFARARELAVQRDASGSTATDVSPADLSPADLSPADRALAALPEQARTALLLRDAYDLPAAAVGAALGTDAEDALRLVAQARLDLPRPDGGPVPAETGHARHADLATLGRLADDRPVAAEDATARRHVLSCASCRASVDTQARAAQLVTGVVVAGLPARDRADVLARVEERARQRLPRGRPVAASRKVRAASGPAAGPGTGALPVAVPPPDGEHGEPDGRRLLSPLLVVLSVVLAVLAGLGLGLLLSAQEAPERIVLGDGELPPGVRLVSPQPTPAGPPPSPPTVAEQRPRTTVVVVPAPALPSPSPPAPSPTPTPSPSPSPTPAAATLALSPASGPIGTTVTVTGAGFPADGPVRVDLLDAAGAPTGSGTDAVADRAGNVTAALAVQDPAAGPGPREVVATAGDVSARATFTVE